MSNENLSPAFAHNNVPVVIAANNLFAPYAGVFIQSLLDHVSEGNSYDIIILERDISKENKRLLKSLAAGRTNISIRFYDPSPLFVSFAYIDEEHHFPLEVFYRIVAPHILNYPGRIIAVDVDTLLKTDVARLMDEDLEGCSVGAVWDALMAGMYLLDRIPSVAQVRLRDYHQDIHGLDNLKNYVSAGLMLFDCEKYIQEVDVKTILNTARTGNYIWPEQDTLNYLMKGRIKLLNLAWNVVLPVNVHKVEDLDAASTYYNEIRNDDKAFQRAHEDPYLLHWGAKPKPWVCPDVPYGNEWWQTALRTPFVGHIIARMLDEQGRRRAYYRERYGKEVDIWEPTPKGIDRT